MDLRGCLWLGRLRLRLLGLLRRLRRLSLGCCGLALHVCSDPEAAHLVVDVHGAALIREPVEHILEVTPLHVPDPCVGTSLLL